MEGNLLPFVLEDIIPAGSNRIAQWALGFDALMQSKEGGRKCLLMCYEEVCSLLNSICHCRTMPAMDSGINVCHPCRENLQSNGNPEITPGNQALCLVQYWPMLRNRRLRSVR